MLNYTQAPQEKWYRFGGKLMGYVGDNGTLDTDYNSSIAARQATLGSGNFRNGATSPTDYADFDQSVPTITSMRKETSELIVEQVSEGGCCVTMAETGANRKRTYVHMPAELAARNTGKWRWS